MNSLSLYHLSLIFDNKRRKIASVLLERLRSQADPLIRHPTVLHAVDGQFLLLLLFFQQRFQPREAFSGFHVHPGAGKRHRLLHLVRSRDHMDLIPVIPERYSKTRRSRTKDGTPLIILTLPPHAAILR